MTRIDADPNDRTKRGRGVPNHTADSDTVWATVWTDQSAQHYRVATWSYSGALAGRVHVSEVDPPDIECPTLDDPTWN